MARIAVLQHAMAPDIAVNLETAQRMMDGAAAGGASLVVFPEVQLSPFFPVRKGGDASAYAMRRDDAAMDALSSLARESGLVTVANIYFEDDDGTRYDASPVFDADGRLLGISKMVHIAQFEKFWEQDYYAPGSGFDVYDTAAGRLGIVICYDRHFPESYRACALQGAEIIATPTCNLAGEPLDLFAWEIRTLAFQNSVYAALANRCGVEGDTAYGGHSVIAGPDGALLAQAGPQPEILLADYDLDHRRQVADTYGWTRNLNPWLKPGFSRP
ncbi:carbon-nitrogen hydrolase family protein [Hyphobacterium marinum]|uniref:Carbon-nitrogen hydrolase family protein n=1 Tax=Hyphobacterium marinum TaxID=3116574 RepID=A0ABU7LX20_9PROT|nr:carbon-nitrogen hydrolase family protein [Hyphobacterium sp. Y6023]MEE2566098.1 carbon-nitrogen hydrolase family protein [Hyphobacterium sp. Y6023]